MTKVRRVGATEYIVRGKLNDVGALRCVNVTFQSERKRRKIGGEIESAFAAGRSRPALTAFHAIYTSESVEGQRRQGVAASHRRIVGPVAIHGGHWRSDFPSHQLPVLSLSLSLPFLLFDLRCTRCRVCATTSFRCAWDFRTTYIFLCDEREYILKDAILQGFIPRTTSWVNFYFWSTDWTQMYQKTIN